MEVSPGFAEKDLPLAWEWFKDVPSARASFGGNKAAFSAWVEGVGDKWAISHGGKCVGIVIFEPAFYPGQSQPLDGFVTFGFARSVWGKGFLTQVGPTLMGEIFGRYPSLRRMTGYTSSRNRAAQHAAIALGCKEEGLLRNGWEDGDLVIFGITKEDYGQRTKDHND